MATTEITIALNPAPTEITLLTIQNLVSTKSPTIKLVEEKQKRSSCWASFHRIFHQGKRTNFVTCRTCNTVLTHNKSSGTSGLTTHIKSCSTTTTTINTLASKQQTLTQLLPQLTPNRKAPTGAKKALAASFAKFVAKDLRPFSIVEGEGFRQLAKQLIELGADHGRVDVGDILPCSNTVRNHVSHQYEDLKKKLRSDMALISSFGVTCDHWTHEQTKYQYLTVTVQYFDNWSLKTAVLQTRLAESKAALETGQETMACLAEFGLEQKLLAIVTDNAPSMPAAFSGQRWIGCVAHQLNLAQKHSFEPLKKRKKASSAMDEDDAEDNNEAIVIIQRLLSHAKELVTLSKRSNFKQDLKTTLLQCVEVRWDSLVAMLQSILGNFDELSALGELNHKISAHLAFIPRSVLIELISILAPLKEIRLSLCVEASPSLHLVLPKKVMLLQSLADKPEQSQWATELKKRLRRNIRDDLVVTSTHRMATILVPKWRGLKGLATDQEREGVIQNLVTMTEQFNPPNVRSSVVMDEILEELDEFSDVPGLGAGSPGTAEAEVREYLAKNLDARSLRLQPNSFWSENQTVFPRLAQVAGFLFSIPATNLSSERNFNYAGLTVTDRRSKIKPDVLDQLLFLRANLYNLV